MLRSILVHALATLLLEGIHRVFEHARLARTCRRLAHYGDRVTLSHGLYIECPRQVRIKDDVSFGPDIKVMGALCLNIVVASTKEETYGLLACRKAQCFEEGATAGRPKHR